MKTINIKSYYKQTGSALPWILVIILLINSIVGWYFYAQSNGSLEKTKKQKQRIQQRYTQKSDELYESWTKLQQSNDNNYQITKQLDQSKAKTENLSIQLENVKSDSRNLIQQINQQEQDSSLLRSCIKEKKDTTLILSTKIRELETNIETQLNQYDENSTLLASCINIKDINTLELSSQIKGLQTELKIQLKQQDKNATLLTSCIKVKDNNALEFSTKITDLQTDIESQVKKLSDKKTKSESELVNLALNCQTDLENNISSLTSQLFASEKKLSDSQLEIQKYQLNYEECIKLSSNKQNLIISLNNKITSNHIIAKKLTSDNKQFREKLAILSTKNQKLKDEIKEVSLGNKNLEAELVRIDEQNSQEIKALKRLKKKLKSEIIAKDISISHYKDKSTRIKVGNDLMFAPGQVHITKKGAKILDKIAELLKRFPNRKIEIIGHTDDVPVRSGSHKLILSNWELSAARSGAAIRYLQHGNKVAPQRMLLVGASQYQPVIEGTSKEVRAKNRRIEICLLPENYSVNEKIESE